jgi:hypothetical protein
MVLLPMICSLGDYNLIPMYSTNINCPALDSLESLLSLGQGCRSLMDQVTRRVARLVMVSTTSSAATISYVHRSPTILTSGKPAISVSLNRYTLCIVANHSVEHRRH